MLNLSCENEFYLHENRVFSNLLEQKKACVIASDFLSQHPSPNRGLWEAKRVST